MTTAREIVTTRVGRRARQFPDMELAPLATDDLDARDSAFAAAIDHAVARRWLTIVALARSVLTRPWRTLEPPVQASLLVGTAQLYFLDRVPAHAAIDEAVTWTKRAVSTRAGGLVNAVLRRLSDRRGETVPRADPDRRDEVPLADGRAWRLTAPVFAEDPRRRVAEQTSHPLPLVERWTELFGPERADALLMHDLVHPPVAVAGLPPGVPGFAPHEEPGHHVLVGERGDLDRALARHPDARVQDPALAAPILSTRNLAPRTIVDACAGKGTKTRQLLTLHPTARVVAAEVDDARRRVLAGTLAHAGDRAAVTAVPATAVPAGAADLLVLDVPCSNTGVLARRVEARYRFGPVTMASLVALQRDIAAATMPLLATGGHVLYVTCSIDPRENEEQVEHLATRHGLRIVDHRTALPVGSPGDPATRYRDGGFFALLVREGEAG